MEALESILRFTRTGHFGHAFRAFEDVRVAPSARTATEVLRAQVLEQVGHAERALAVAKTLLQSKHLTISHRSECEAIVGRILFEEGDARGGLSHLQRAALSAQETTDLHAMFGATLFMFVIVSDRSGPAAGASVLSDLRQIATRLGDPEVTARLHLFVAQAEAKRGLLENAKRHTDLARRILKASANVYLAAFVANLDLAIAVLQSDFMLAKDCGRRAVEFADQSGVGKIRKAVFGNMGNLYYELGDFDRARTYFENALALLPASGANTTAVLESLARVHLLQGRAESCLSVLDQIESSIRVEQDRFSYEQRYSALTRVHLLAHQGLLQKALLGTVPVLELAARAGDGLLQKQVQLTRADLLQQLRQVPSSMALIAEIVPGLTGLSPELYARSEQILACALAPGSLEDGELHRGRAHRVYQSIGSIPRLQELELCWNQARSIPPDDAPSDERIALEDTDRQGTRGVRLALHGIAAAFTHAARPELVARELIEVLAAAQCTYTARATVQALGDTQEVICESSSGSDSAGAERRLSVGFRMIVKFSFTYVRNRISSQSQV